MNVRLFDTHPWNVWTGLDEYDVSGPGAEIIISNEGGDKENMPLESPLFADELSLRYKRES